MKKTMAFAALALVAASSFAAPTGWYVGGDVGTTKFEADGKESKTGFGITAGYQFNSNAAVEIQARRLGSWDEDGLSVKANAVQASVLGFAPISDTFAFYIRLGYGRNSLEFSESGLDLSLKKSTGFIGIGGSYQIDKNLSARLEYSDLGKNSFELGSATASVKMKQFNVGLNYAF